MTEESLRHAAWEREGFVFLSGSLVSVETCAAIADEFDSHGTPGRRHLLDSVNVRHVLSAPLLVKFVQEALGTKAFAYKATLFDKSEDANWLVAWHQDITIPVSGRVDSDDWRGWSIKDGVQYVVPPDTLLGSLAALRIHIDPCDELNGPLKVLVGSHALGRLPHEKLHAVKSQFRERVITGPRGSALLMRPLLLHSSAKARSGQRRRVLHLEFAASELPNGLCWHRRFALGDANDS